MLCTEKGLYLTTNMINTLIIGIHPYRYGNIMSSVMIFFVQGLRILFPLISTAWTIQCTIPKRSGHINTTSMALTLNNCSGSAFLHVL